MEFAAFKFQVVHLLFLWVFCGTVAFSVWSIKLLRQPCIQKCILAELQPLGS